MELMKQFEDNHFDLAICDPPYGIGAAKEKPHNGWADWGIKQWDNEAPDEAYFAELKRVSKNQIIWGANHFIERMPKQNTPCWLIWDKGQRNFSLADGEMAWTSFDKAMRIFTYARAKALQEGKIHPTQKPKQLYKWILKNFAKDGDKILDTHLGSGSIAIAVDSMNKIEKLNLTLTASEIDAEYFERTMKRINNELAQTSLF
jgi:site-specific DNA-methyltransferase (adenine-specific)